MIKREIIKKWKSGRGYRYLLICQNCGEEFEKCGKQINNDKCYFCSVKCSNSFPKKIKQINQTKQNRYKQQKQNSGYAFTLKARRRMSVGQKGKPIWNKGKFGEAMPNWQGGISFEPYTAEFNNGLKLQIRKRDNYTCQECGKTEKQLKRKLSIHHIDYNKKNNDENNLISLCSKCHGKTNFKRKDWTTYFQKK